MHNFNTVLKFELIRTFKKPSFWFTILAIPGLMAIVFTIIYFSNTTSEQELTQIEKQPFSLVVKDDTGMIDDTLLGSLDAKRIDDKQSGIDMVQNGQIDAFFYYPVSISANKIEVFNKNDGLVDNSKFTTVAGNLIKAAATLKVGSADILTAVTGTAAISQTNFENGESVNPIGKIIVPAMFLIVFYAVIVLLGNQMLTSTTEEKENRVTEMLLTSVTSTALIVGKIVSLIILGFVQILVILVPLIIAYFTAREALNIPDLSVFISTIQVELWPTVLGAALLVSGFLLFTGLLVGIGAAMPTAKEANSFFGIVITFMIVPFWFFSLLMTNSNSPVIDILSYFPLTAPFTLLIRNIFGVISLPEALIGLTIVSISGVFVLFMAIRIFKYGTIEYSSRLSLKTIFKKTKRA